MSKNDSSLAVYVCGIHCGTLREDVHGAMSFEYDEYYDGIPLSMSMPVSLARYEDRVVRPYFMGLLPDEEGTRASIGAAYGVSGDNPFRLLKVLGADCPGAVQVVPCDVTASREIHEHDYVRLSNKEVAERLGAIRENAAAAWIDAAPSEHWSLGGCQAKMALRCIEGAWFECRGYAATTHILKPGVAGFDNQALVEYLSMKLARAMGLPVANVSYHVFYDEPAIVIERYDRRVLADGTVERIHQEDFCQSLSVSPSAKYAEQGGPTTPRILALLSKTGNNARENAYRFILYLFFNYLIGATDAHAKNHSLVFLDKDDVRIAPLYDVASIAPYRSLSPRRRKPLRAALSIGGENRFGMLSPNHIEKMVSTCSLEALDLGADMLCGRLVTMASMIPSALENVLSEATKQGIADVEKVSTGLYEEISQHCGRILRRFS